MSNNYKYTLGVFVSFFLFLTLLSAQEGNTFPLGCSIDEDSDKSYMESLKIPSFSGSKYGDIPMTYSLRKHTPYAGNQGRIGSCVGWSAGYAAYSTAVAKQNNITDRQLITDNAYSALYVFNQIAINGNCQAGSKISDACELLKNHGDIRASDFETEKENCSKKPTEQAILTAGEHKVKDYFRLFDIDDSPKVKVYKTKQALAQGNPVIAGFALKKNFGYIKKDNPTWVATVGDTQNWGGHAMCVIGYHEGRKAFEVMNSWGQGWGDEGFVWIKYEDFAKYCKYGFQLILSKDAKLAASQKAIVSNHTNPTTSTDTTSTTKITVKNTVELKGKFNYRAPVWNEDFTQLSFRDVPVQKAETDYLYETLDSTKIGDNFQLLAEEITKNSYLYVFSIDGEGAVGTHWPRNQSLNREYDSLLEGSIVTSEKAQIVIPGEDRVLIKDKPKDDYLIILYCDTDLGELGPKLATALDSADSDNITTQLQSVLKDRLVPSRDINYTTGKIDFTSSSNKGDVVPVILKVKGLKQ